MIETLNFLSDKQKEIYQKMQGYLGLALLTYYFIAKVLERFSFTLIRPYFSWKVFTVLAVGYILLFCKFTWKSILATAVVMIISCGTGEWYNYCGFLFIIICSKVDLKKLEIIVFTILTSFIGTSALLVKLGKISSNDRLVRELRYWYVEDKTSDAVKHALGMVHPNTAGLLVAEAVLLMFMIFWTKLKWWHWGIAAGTCVFIWKYIDCRSALILLGTSLFFMALMKIFPKMFECRPVRIVLSLSPVIMAVISFVLAWMYDNGNELAVKINNMSTGRVANLKNAIQSTNITLFGYYEGYYLDNMYGWSLYVHGILFAVLITSLYVMMLIKLFKDKNHVVAAVGIGYVCFSFFENLASNPIYNPFWWWAGAMIMVKTLSLRNSSVNKHLDIRE